MADLSKAKLAPAPAVAAAAAGGFGLASLFAGKALQGLQMSMSIAPG